MIKCEVRGGVMGVDFKQEGFTEEYFNRVFKGLSFAKFGLDLPAVKEVVEVEQIENYKKPLLMLLLENDSLLHIEIMNVKSKLDLQSMLTYDMSIALRYRMQVNTIILNFGNRQQGGEIEKNFGSVHYNTQVVDLSGLDGERVHEELSQKISSDCLLDERDKLNLVFLPFMKNSLTFNEVLPKVMSLLERMKDEEERMAYLTVISEIISRLIGKQGVEVLKEYLMDTEVGVRIKDEGKKEGMRESIMVILLGKFNVLPDDVYYAIAEQKNENTLMKWLQNVTSICSIDELKKIVFNID
jgi:predicted CopG family antitoxin